jgi:hypothetical protein
MTKKEFASQRNWQLLRLMGQKHINLQVLTHQEQSTAVEIQRLISDLIAKWDSNSEQLGMKLLPYKCEYPGCGRRSSVSHIYIGDSSRYFQNVNFCLKHFKQVSKDATDRPSS